MAARSRRTARKTRVRARVKGARRRATNRISRAKRSRAARKGARNRQVRRTQRRLRAKGRATRVKARKQVARTRRKTESLADQAMDGLRNAADKVTGTIKDLTPGI